MAVLIHWSISLLLFSSVIYVAVKYYAAQILAEEKDISEALFPGMGVILISLTLAVIILCCTIWEIVLTCIVLPFIAICLLYKYVLKKLLIKCAAKLEAKKD